MILYNKLCIDQIPKATTQLGQGTNDNNPQLQYPRSKGNIWINSFILAKKTPKIKIKNKIMSPIIVIKIEKDTKIWVLF
jgi:hypothetical protein